MNKILQRKQAAEDYLNQKRDLWDKLEQINHGQLGDGVSSKTKSQVFDHRLSTLNYERGYRVMAQLPTGKVRAISKNDEGSSKLMDLVLDKYVFLNANSQFDFLTKLRMMDIYSGIYGNFFGLVDWTVNKNGYVGPDLWMLNIRDVFPQVGAMSIEDSDYIIVRSWRPLSFFEGLKKDKSYKNIQAIITKIKDSSGSKQQRDSKAKTQREEDQYSNDPSTKGAGYFEVLSMYEKDKWTDYCVDADMEFRDMKNPHDNGELPVVCKYSIPLMDDFFGTSDVERGAPMQMTMNSVWNLYLDSVKMSIFPPVLINKDNVAQMSSIKWGPAQKWMVRNQVNNSVSPIQLNPQGIQTFNNTYSVANASILNLFGTSDTTISSETDSGQGKTPQALKMQGARENTRDTADRYYMERFLSSVVKKMVNLVSKKQSSSITIRMFKDEIDELAEDYPEIEEMYDEKTGKLSIGNKKVGSTLYDWEIVSGSTYANDQEAQRENITQYISLYLKSEGPQGNMLDIALQRNGFKFNFGELFKRGITNSGIQDWDKILEEQKEEEIGQQSLDQDAQAFEQAMQQAMSGVPPQPQGQPQQGIPQQMPQGLPVNPMQ